MTPDMAFECLLVSHDPEVVGPIDRMLRNLSICTNLCLSSTKAINLMARKCTDLFVIDWEDQESAELLEQIWKSAGRQKPTIVAVSPLDHPIRGVHFVLCKPVTRESSAKSLKVAYARMLQDHRRHARHSLMVSVMANDEKSRTVPVTVTDIGDGGLGLSTKKALTVGDVLSFHLQLPGAKKEIYIQVRVLWARDYGTAGCEFLRIPPVDLNILNDWLKQKSQVKKPLIEF